MRSMNVRWLAGAYAVGLAYLLLAPEPLFFLGRTGADIDEAVSSTIADWVEHGTVYAVLTILLIATGDARRVILPMLAAVAHGAVTETLQHWIPPREASW
ncbi:MAG TPA: VanZ family protein, partial [Caulifigura sp.]|nr:VanZ family protein [Caulifigura sp.]